MTIVVRRALQIALLFFVSGSASVYAGQLDPNDPDDALTIGRKIGCSTVEAKPITYWWHGSAYSRRQGERDKLLFKVEGMNVRSCTSISDPKKGDGYKLVSREILLYKDPETGEVLSTWDNPWSGETVDVLHVANDPVNFTAYKVGRDGSPSTFTGTIIGDRWWNSTEVPLWYPNPLASEYQKEIGGTYHATEMFNFMGDTESLFSTETTTAEVQVGWARMSDWLPWMMMNGREGVIYMHTAGRKLDSWDELSETMKHEINTHYPDYVGPPPSDDSRRNETSWLYYKKIRDGDRVVPERD
ncbi:MAG: DUF1838 domain-containing protein [Gammaproteobacteria bacterium]|nr:DUF1838 domain-containing protein [Gammaproteobacteria bacterium]